MFVYTTLVVFSETLFNGSSLHTVQNTVPELCWKALSIASWRRICKPQPFLTLEPPRALRGMGIQRPWACLALVSLQRDRQFLLGHETFNLALWTLRVKWTAHSPRNNFLAKHNLFGEVLGKRGVSSLRVSSRKSASGGNKYTQAQKHNSSKTKIWGHNY